MSKAVLISVNKPHTDNIHTGAIAGVDIMCIMAVNGKDDEK